MTTTPILDPATLRLAKGSHADGPPPGDPDCEMCLFEAYNVLLVPPDRRPDAELTDDRPADVSPVLHAFGMRLNDILDDDRRQQLKIYLPNGVSPLAGTYRDGLDETRQWMAADWAVRTALPIWLDAAGVGDRAGQLRALPRIVDRASSVDARPLVRTVADEAYERRRAWRKELKAKIAEELAGRRADAAAVAVAAADADAGAGAGAGAVAVAVAGAVAGAAADAAAAAVAAADAAADAAAAAVADAAAVAVAVADADRYWVIRKQAYDAAYTAIQERYAPTIGTVHDSAVALYAAMVHPEPGGLA